MAVGMPVLRMVRR